MKTLFLSSFILFCLIIFYNNRKHTKMLEKQEKAFWDREAAANSTRRKSLDGLEYITIPLDFLPMETMKEDTSVQELLNVIKDLSTVKIVNLTGFTNTDLKLEYGAANITCLSDYDASYTLLARTLQEWAEILFKNGFISEAQTILEFAVSTKTDVSQSFYLLADIYERQGESSKIEDLIAHAGSLRSSMSPVIVRTLQGSGPYSGWLRSV
ncbi:MAG: hypothetical protein ACI4EQ_08035 [Lachnospiraceae bacterium]